MSAVPRRSEAPRARAPHRRPRPACAARSERHAASPASWAFARSTCGLTVPGLVGDAALAQFVFLHLAALGAGQFADEFEIARHREIGQARLAERDQLGFVER